jgi:hypothetical protein
LERFGPEPQEGQRKKKEEESGRWPQEKSQRIRLLLAARAIQLV